METPKKSENSIDAGAASMAYMPGVSGKTEAEASESELTIDKKAEKRTMADIASELEAEDKAAAVKVPVGGKPVVVKAAPAAKKAEKVEPPFVINDSTTPHDIEAELDDMPEEHKSPSNVKPRRKIGRVMVVLTLIIVLAGAGTLGWLWYRSLALVSELKTQVSTLETSERDLRSQLDSAAAVSDVEVSPTPIPAGTTRTIPEVALTYKLTDTTKKVTYSYSELTDSAGSVHSLIRFNSTDLIGAERKVVTDPTKYTCMTDDAPLGTLQSYKATDTVPSGGKASALKPDGKTTFKLGETYFIYTSQQSACSTDKTVQAAQTAGKVLVTELLSTLAR